MKYMLTTSYNSQLYLSGEYLLSSSPAALLELAICKLLDLFCSEIFQLLTQLKKSSSRG